MPSPKVFKAELPAVWLDPVILDTDTTRLRVINRNPEPGERDVALNSNIDLQIIDTGTVTPGVSLAATRIYVDGVLAYDGSSGTPFKTGYDGSGSLVSAVGSNGYDFFLNKTTPNFLPETTVTVRVVSGTTTGGATLDTTYTFTTPDDAPVVVSAQSTALLTVLVAFDDDMRQLGDLATADALTPANYVLMPLAVPAVTPTVVAVSAVTSNLVALTLDMEITGGVLYRVTVSNVLNADGEAVGPPFNTADFTGFVCPAPLTRDFDLYSMMPAMNRREDRDGTGNLKRFLACIQEVVNLQLCEIDDYAARVLDLDTAEEKYLDKMLSDLGNPFAFDLDVTHKRLLLRILIPIYKKKGTGPGIIDVILFFLKITVTIQPYTDVGMSLGESELGSDGTDGTWELGPSGSFAKYAFNVISPVVLTEDQETQIRGLVNYMKPAHTHFVFLIEPSTPPSFDHLELGESELGSDGTDGTWILH